MIRFATAADFTAILALLRSAGLPLVGIPQEGAGFFVAAHHGDVLGCVGLESHAAHGLLRSLVVAPSVRGTGVGAALVARAVAASRVRGDADCWLITESASGWFPRFGFRSESREALPDALTGAIDHHGVCPSSAVMLRRASGSALRVLVLCTGNSARSQLGEALLATLGGAMIVAGSAGSRPAARINPMALTVLAEHGIAWESGVPKTIDSIADAPWDLVLTVCDAAKEACPIFPGATVMAHWGMPDPADLEPTERRHAAFSAVHAALRASVTALLDVVAVTAPGDLSRASVLALAPSVTEFA